MIILIDNKNYMIRYCQDEPEIHGFDVSFPNWQAYTKLLSDIGYTVVLSGEEAEEYLDANNIYYIHIENKPKENFVNFTKRLQKLIKENEDYLKVNTSYGKLVWGVTEQFTTDATADSLNLVEVWRLNEDGKYYISISVDEEMPKYALIAVLERIENLLLADFDVDIEEVKDLFYGYEDEEELSSATSIHEMAVKLDTLLSVIANK